MQNSIITKVFSKCAAFMHIFLIATFAQNCFDSRSRSGNCITLAACPNLVEEFYDEARSMSYGIDFQTFVSESICGFDGTNFLICCTIRTASSLRPPRHQPYAPTFAPTNRPNYPGYQLPPDTLFHFAALGGSNPPPMVYPSNPQYPTMPPVVFQPTFGFPPNSGVTQPTPYPTMYPPPVGTTVIYQPLPNVPPTTPNVQYPTQPSSNGCGISRGTTNRVVGGVEAKRGTYPWIAALGYQDEYDRNALKYLCAGSLVTSNYVITSAHCISATLTLVRLGAHDLSNPSEPNAMDFRIKRTVVHENFNLQSIANDIAVVELTAPAPNTNFIGPICLPESSNFLTQDFVGMNPFIAGWGAAKHQGPTSNVLRDVQVPIVSRQTCEQSYRSVFKFVEFSEKLICAGNSNVDACQGDSGGPLMMPQLEGVSYRYYLLGIVSYGYECARTGFPGVYTRVASYMPWVKRQLM